MIKFNCPHCKKLLKVKEELSGKKAKCPGCQKAITIPKPADTAAALVPAPNAAELEALAAAALADQPVGEAAPPEEKKTFEIQCPFCDEKVQMPRELAGKQGPCPACRRIIRVPMPVDDKPKDWRQKENRLPSGARRDTEPAPEGAWGTAVSTGRVSSQALAEADALPVVRERVTVRQWIVRVGAAAAAVILIATGIWGMLHLRHQQRQDDALTRALAFLPEENRPARTSPPVTAEIYRGVGEYYARANKPEDAQKDFRRARAQALQEKVGSLEREFILMDLALNQVDLGGNPNEVIDRTRLPWDAVQKELQQTLQTLTSPEARVLAMREVGRKLVARDQGPLAISLAHVLGRQAEAPELLGIVGLEMVAADKRSAAEDVARQALASYETPPAKGDDKSGHQPPPMAPSLVALLVAVDQQAKAEKTLLPPRTRQNELNEEVRPGYAQGWALQGKIDDAMALANARGGPLHRLEALLDVAEALADKNPAGAKPAAEAAVNVVQGELKRTKVSPWWLIRLVRVSLKAGVAGDQVQALIDPWEGALHARADLEVVRARLAASNQPDLKALNDAATQPAPNGLVVEALARHAARLGGSQDVTKTAANWDEQIQPLAFVGLALGVQDIK